MLEGRGKVRPGEGRKGRREREGEGGRKGGKKIRKGDRAEVGE